MDEIHATTVFQKVATTSATIDVKPEKIVVSRGKRANNTS